MQPIACGDSLAGCSTPPDQMQKLLEAGTKCKAYRHWDRIRIGRSQQDITGNGFNAIRFDPRKPAHTIRRMDSNLGMGGAMHWEERTRFSLPEFKRFSSFPDQFIFAGEFEERNPADRQLRAAALYAGDENIFVTCIGLLKRANYERMDKSNKDSVLSIHFCGGCC